MSLVKDMLRPLVYSLGIKKRLPVLSREEQWRARGVKFGKNFDGPDSSIDYCYGHLVTIGDNVTISGTTILAHDGSTKKSLGYVKVAPVKIGSDVFIGYGSVVLPGVTIGNKVIVGAGTICSKDIPDNVVVVGGVTRFIECCVRTTSILKNKEKGWQSYRFRIYAVQRERSPSGQIGNIRFRILGQDLIYSVD